MRLVDIESESFLNEMREKKNACKEIIQSSDDAELTWTERDYWEGVYGMFVEMALTLKKQPTVYAAPVKYGHWEDVGSLSCRCSECGCKNDRGTLFCPNCGAKMDFLYDLRGQNGFGVRTMTTDELTAWDVFEAITSAYGGKQIFFLQKNGMVYDRYKADYITFEEAMNRFCRMIGGEGI